MSTDPASLALLLDGPFQSWGFASRFQRRATGLHPTKSGVVGLICAAMGLAKGSPDEAATLPALVGLRMTSLLVPRMIRGSAGAELPVLRLEDYHTVLDTRRADGSMNKDAVITRRQYLLDARFGVLLEGDRDLLIRVAAALRDPVWGVWLGRKNCIPAAPILIDLAESRQEALEVLLRGAGLHPETPMDALSTVTEVEEFAAGTDSIGDQPVSFGEGSSSGTEGRRFVTRRIAVRPRSRFL
jgi:CRISPR system Cascade subunit CasD